MQKRRKEVMVWLSEEEYVGLKSKVEKTGLSMQSYLRHLISSVQPKEKPSADFFETLKILRQISNNLNQIAVKAHSIGFVDAPEYKRNVEWLRTAISDLVEAMFR